ncbi:MAG: glycosyltransferase family 2 protein [Anaerolineae bacterium]
MTQQPLPTISIITPTYNSAQFLEQTIESVLSQGYPNLEYIIIDGNSSDETVAIIERYQAHLAYWVSEPDGGMYDAIQKGFDRSTGAIMGWLNSDDVHFPWTLTRVAELFTQFEQVKWVTSNIIMGMDEAGLPVYASQVPGYSRAGYRVGEHLPTASRKFALEYIVQEATFWRRALWDDAGGYLDQQFKYAGDSELWMRFFDYADLYDVSIPLGQFRMHANQITSALRTQYDDEVEAILRKHGAQAHGTLKAGIRRLAHRYTPDKLRRVLAGWGWLHRSQRIQYHTTDKQWKIRKGYY